MIKRKLLFFSIIMVGVFTGLLMFYWDNFSGKTQLPVPLPINESNQEVIPPEGAFAIRGIIEGFYGTPWTNTQRKDIFCFMKQNYFNFYVYAPKDDPYQRIRWWEKYPSADVQSLKELVKLGEENGISFVYSISPGIPQPLPGEKLTEQMINNSVTFSSQADLQKLITKIAQLNSIGINTFMLSLDDVRPSLKSEDQKIYGQNYARAHIDLANKIFAEEKKINPSFELWFAPTKYYGVKDNSYWKEIRQRLDPSIKVIWTGSWVLNKQITTEQAALVGDLLGRKPLIWDNYPVNDYTYTIDKAPRLMMGPLKNRSADLSSIAAGYLTNPMIQPESSKIPLATIGQYLWNPKTYNPNTALVEALTEAVETNDSHAFWKFCSYSASSILNGNKDQSGFSILADSFWQEYRQKRSGNARDILEQELIFLSDLPDRLDKTVSNRALLKEINPWLTKLSQAGEAGRLALKYLDGSALGQKNVGQQKQLEQKLIELKNNKLNIGNGIISFIENCLAYSTQK